MYSRFQTVLRDARDFLTEPATKILSAVSEGRAAQGPHSHSRTLEHHLLGTYKILKAWRAPGVVQIAGLCHSLYSTDRYGVTTIERSERKKLRALIGTDPEALVYKFCAMRRREFINSLMSSDVCTSNSLVPFPVRDGWECEATASKKDAANLVLIMLANLAEQGNERALALPGRWLATFSSLLSVLRKLDPAICPNSLKAWPMIVPGNETEVQRRYQDLIAAATIGGDVEERLEQMLRTCGMFGEPYIWTAWALLRSGEVSKSRANAKRAVDAMSHLGFVWDKRLTIKVWRRLADQLTQARLAEENDHLLMMLSALGRPRESLSIRHGDTTEGMARFLEYLNSVGISNSPAAVGVYPGLEQKAVYDKSEFAVAQQLEDAYEQIRDEVLRLDSAIYHDEAESIARSGSWKVVMLYEAGKRHDRNCAMLPSIAAIVDSSPDVRRIGGLVYLSRLAPGTKVSPHRGGTNMRLRCHLGIQIPGGDCGMRVDKIRQQWTEGKCIVFDDSLEHEVWNNTSEPRIVLLIDLWHPGLSAPERAALTTMNLYGLRHGLGLSKYWQRNDAAAQGAGLALQFDDH